MFPILTDEQRRFVSTVRELAQSEFRERAQRYMDGTFPWENMKRLAELGVLGMAVPEEYGGLGLPVFDTALVLEEIAKACYVTAMAVLGEVGSRAANDGLERLAGTRRSLQPAIRTARRHIAERLARGAPTRAAAEAHLPRLVLFGPPQLQIDGRPVAASVWRAQRAFHLLVFLALHPRGSGKDELLEHFWPGRQLAAGRRNFHPTLSYVRSVLPRPASVTAGSDRLER